MRVLNVAAKDDAAKNIAQLLAPNGDYCYQNGLSKYNKIYMFNANVPLLGGKCSMILTSISGHLMNFDFDKSLSNWQTSRVADLFEAPILQRVDSRNVNNDLIRRTLEREARTCQALIIWTDNDREGENIGFEIIRLCYEANRNLLIHRARFSELTAAAMSNAIINLVEPNENMSLAIDVCMELDLRFGAIFTRFQTLLLQRTGHIENSTSNRGKIISYGTCQFPTMGFVIERYLAMLNFKRQSFWYIDVTHTKDRNSAIFKWDRYRLFDEHTCLAFYAKILERPQASVTNITTELVTGRRPEPMCTTQLEKLSNIILELSAKETMTIAEKLYIKGFISYPRTETNRYSYGINLNALVEQQVRSEQWGEFAQRILDDGGAFPRQGDRTDYAHPPIHPTKYARDLTGKDAALYELITRHFLACMAKDAKGTKTVINININGETFTTNGLSITEPNYLKVYTYKKWSDKKLPPYSMSEEFVPAEIMMLDSATSPPKLLTEAQLISLMEKAGIGTDAKHAEHIEKIVRRNYVKKLERNKRFCPTKLGLALYSGYQSMRVSQLTKPQLRCRLEQDLDNIAKARRHARDVVREYIEEFKRAYAMVELEQDKLVRAFVRVKARDEPEIRLRNVS